MSFTDFVNIVVHFIATLPPLFTAAVISCLAILIALAIKRAVF